MKDASSTPSFPIPNCQRASRPDLTVARACCIVDDNFTSSERHGHRPTEKSSVAVVRFRSNSKVSPAMDSQSRRRLDIASSSGGIFGAGDARRDRDSLRRVEFFLECECFWGGEPVWERGLFWDGEPPCEPFSTNSFSQTPARSAPRPPGINISSSVIGREGEPPCEPVSTNSFSQTPARSAPRPPGIGISAPVI